MDMFSHCPEPKDSSVVDGYSLDQWIFTPPLCKLNRFILISVAKTCMTPERYRAYELSNGTRWFIYTHAKIKVILQGQWNCETFYNLSNIDSKNIALLNVSSGPRETMITFLDQKVVLVSFTFIQPSVTALFLVTITSRHISLNPRSVMTEKQSPFLFLSEMHRNETTGDKWKCGNKQRDSGARKRSWGFVSPHSSGEARDPAHLDTLLFGLKGYVPQKSGFRISYPKRDNELNQGSVAWHQFKLPVSISSGVLSETKNIATEFPSPLFFNCFHFLRVFFVRSVICVSSFMLMNGFLA